ncbi:hypothetical protein WA158_001792 [Blastocystis sp. Blastoise]
MQQSNSSYINTNAKSYAVDPNIENKPVLIVKIPNRIAKYIDKIDSYDIVGQMKQTSKKEISMKLNLETLKKVDSTIDSLNFPLIYNFDSMEGCKKMRLFSVDQNDDKFVFEGYKNKVYMMKPSTSTIQYVNRVTQDYRNDNNRVGATLDTDVSRREVSIKKAEMQQTKVDLARSRPMNKTNMSESDIRKHIFKLFSKKAYYTKKEILSTLPNISSNNVASVLNEICTYHKNNEFKNYYELADKYKTNFKP